MKQLPGGWLKDRKTFESACRARSRFTVFGDVLMHLDPDDESLTPDLVRDGYWESWVSLAIAEALKPGAVCIDAGAHCGYYSLLMALRDAAKVVAVEPQPRLADLTRKTMRLNGFQDIVTIRQAALGDKSGVISLNLYGQKTGDASYVPRANMTPSGKVMVQLITMDQLTEGWSKLDLVKIDCEGAETAIWAGMAETRRRFPEMTVVMEVDKDRGYDLAAFLEQITTDGYPLRIVAHNGEPEDVAPEKVLETEGWSTLWLQR